MEMVPLRRLSSRMQTDNPATYHIDLMTQIKNSSYLYLKFPDLVLEKDQTLKDVLSKDLTNTGSIVGIPANRGEGEPDITTEDSFIFRLTSRDLEGAGSFAKKQMGMFMIQQTISSKLQVDHRF